MRTPFTFQDISLQEVIILCDKDCSFNVLHHEGVHIRTSAYFHKIMQLLLWAENQQCYEFAESQNDFELAWGGPYYWYCIWFFGLTVSFVYNSFVTVKSEPKICGCLWCSVYNLGMLLFHVHLPLLQITATVLYCIFCVYYSTGIFHSCKRYKT